MSSTNHALGPNAPVPVDAPGTSPSPAISPVASLCPVASITQPSLPVCPDRKQRTANRPRRRWVSVVGVAEPLTSVTCNFSFEAVHRLAWRTGKCMNLHVHPRETGTASVELTAGGGS